MTWLLYSWERTLHSHSVECCWAPALVWTLRRRQFWIMGVNSAACKHVAIPSHVPAGAVQLQYYQIFCHTAAVVFWTVCVWWTADSQPVHRIAWHVAVVLLSPSRQMPRQLDPSWSCQQPVNINTRHIPIAVYTAKYLLMMSTKLALETCTG